MKVNEKTLQTPPPGIPRSTRGDRWRGLTSVKAGVINPIAFFPLLREDRITGTINVQVKMDETVKPLLNAVKAQVKVYLYPNTADERFSGIEQLNASYAKMPDFGGIAPPPFLEMVPYVETDIHRVLGVHEFPGFATNNVLLRAYNRIVNARRQARSDHIPLRAADDGTLAEAFWMDPNRWSIVPDFDEHILEGEVAVDGYAPVRGIGSNPGNTTAAGSLQVIETGGVGAMYDKTLRTNVNTAGFVVNASGDDPAAMIPQVFAEMKSAGVFVSLANIRLAEKTAAFARLREMYQGTNDEYIVDMLMSGIRVPDSQLWDPILLGSDSGVFGLQERHATDYENLDKSLTTGMLSLRVPIATPAINPGGMVYVLLEIVPESLPELGSDPYLNITDTLDLPDYQDDALDPQKVDIVWNQDIDTYHSKPAGVFGYTHLNAKWNRDFARLGGKFMTGQVPSVSEERNRIWQVRPTDPVLSRDFYLCPKPFPHDVFADTQADPFEVTTLATMLVNGLTVFGEPLQEDQDAWEKTLNTVDQGRIDQNATAILEAERQAKIEQANAEAQGEKPVQNEESEEKE